MSFKFLTLVALFILSGCGGSTEVTEQSSPSISVSPNQSSPAPVIKISNIAGKTPDEVSKILGLPTSTETVSPSRTPCPCEKNTYKNGKIEIVFMEGKADWITIKNLNDAPYSVEALTLLGIKQKSPSFSNENVIRWTNIPGLLEVSIFPVQGLVDYAYIKTATP
jgi:hypothetical protein